MTFTHDASVLYNVYSLQLLNHSNRRIDEHLLQRPSSQTLFMIEPLKETSLSVQVPGHGHVTVHLR